MIPESLQIGLERTGLPVKDSYTGHELVDLLTATSDLSPSAQWDSGTPFLLTQRQVAECLGMTQSNVNRLEEVAILKLRREGGLHGFL